MEEKPFIIIGSIALVTIVGFICFGLISNWNVFSNAGKITNFDECAAAGYPVMESYPRQCRANNQTFAEVISGGDVSGGDMTLVTKTWVWAGTQTDNGRVIAPRQENVFTVTFNEDGRVSLTTDCNSMGGEYIVNGNKIIFDKIMATLMGCPAESQESEFSVFLQETPSYRFTELGELVLEMDSGTMFLR
jgi:heat shock protein HslJ